MLEGAILSVNSNNQQERFAYRNNDEEVIILPHKDPEARRIWRREYSRRRRESIAYRKYTAMINRVRSLSSYKDVKICDDQRKSYALFQNWFNNECKLIGLDPENKDDCKKLVDYHIDKDYSRSKLYSPNTCILIPRRLNHIIQNSDNDHVEFKPNATHCKYSVRIGDARNGRINIGSFPTKSEAIKIGVQVKALVIRFWNEYYYSRNLISKRAYDTVERYVQIMILETKSFDDE